jgi:hypothetical protein
MFGVIDGCIRVSPRWSAGSPAFRRPHVAALAGRHRPRRPAVSRLAWLVIGARSPLIAATVTADRIGKGIRTAPRDALISLSSAPQDLGGAFGVHRAMDAAGAMQGPLVAFALLAVAAGRFDLVFVVSFAVVLVDPAPAGAAVPGHSHVRGGDARRWRYYAATDGVLPAMASRGAATISRSG